MKKYFILTISLFSLSLSCTKDFKDINTDPNNPGVVPTAYLLTNAEKNMMDNLLFESWSGYFSLLTAQYWTQNNYTEQSRYLFSNGLSNFFFDFFYSDGLREADEIIQLNTSNHIGPVSENQIAIARVLKAWMFQEMTDVWGPIPYSEALKGADNRTPAYDAQRDIYLDLVQELKESIVQMDTGAESFGSADVIYGGDVSQWKKFANSLLLRVAIRMADVEPDSAKAAVEIGATGTFSSNDDNAYFRYLSVPPNNNPHNTYRQFRGDADHCLSNVLIDHTLLPLNDPRLSAFADPAISNGAYKGRPVGQSSAVAASESTELYSQPSGALAVLGGASFRPYDVLRPEAQGVFMNYAEVCFALAEARERGWNVPGTAADWYHKGIAASLGEWGITDQSVIDDYLAQSTVNYETATGDWKQKIGVQKWLALFMQGVQGWSEWRRLDFDKLIPPVAGALVDIGDSPSPLRLTYPTNEQTRNGTNYQAALDLLGGADNLKTHLWWDVE